MKHKAVPHYRGEQTSFMKSTAFGEFQAPGLLNTKTRVTASGMICSMTDGSSIDISPMYSQKIIISNSGSTSLNFWKFNRQNCQNSIDIDARLRALF